MVQESDLLLNSSSSSSKFRRGHLLVTVALLGVTALALIVAAGSYSTNDTTTELGEDDSSMKTIDALLARIHKITHSYDTRLKHKQHRSHDSSSSLSVGSSSASDSGSVGEPGSNSASNDVNENDDGGSLSSSIRRPPSLNNKKMSKAKLAAKMDALRKQIQSDFASVTTFGHKAGYLPPIKPVKM